MICRECARGDHSQHRAELASVCVGCECQSTCNPDGGSQAQAELLDEPWWETRPGKMGGQPCYRGTRITVATIRECLTRFSPEQVQAMYPDLTVAQIELAREPIVEACGCAVGGGHRCPPPFAESHLWPEVGSA